MNNYNEEGPRGFPRVRHMNAHEAAGTAVGNGFHHVRHVNAHEAVDLVRALI